MWVLTLTENHTRTRFIIGDPVTLETLQTDLKKHGLTDIIVSPADDRINRDRDEETRASYYLLKLYAPMSIH